MNERELLINKFLAGETTIEEEQMLARIIEGEAEYKSGCRFSYLTRRIVGVTSFHTVALGRTSGT